MNELGEWEVKYLLACPRHLSYVICGRIFNQMRIADFLIILFVRARADHEKESCKGLEFGI